MYKIEKKAKGFRLTFTGHIKTDEMQKWVEESKQALVGAPTQFTVEIDMRGLTALDADTQKTMILGQTLYKDKGMVKSAVLVDKRITKMQFERLAKDSGIFAWERYFSVEQPDWRKAMDEWLDT